MSDRKIDRDRMIDDSLFRAHEAQVLMTETLASLNHDAVRLKKAQSLSKPDEREIERLTAVVELGKTMYEAANNALNQHMSVALELIRVDEAAKGSKTVTVGGMSVTTTPANPCSNHNPVAHRDGKVPWCNNCGLTASGTVPQNPFQKPPPGARTSTGQQNVTMGLDADADPYATDVDD